jgi:hypothetical protein
VKIKGDEREIEKDGEDRVGIIVAVEVLGRFQAVTVQDLVTGYGYEKRKDHIKVKAEVTAEAVAAKRTHYYCNFQQCCQEPDRVSQRTGQGCVSCARLARLIARAIYWALGGGGTGAPPFAIIGGGGTGAPPFAIIGGGGTGAPPFAIMGGGGTGAPPFAIMGGGGTGAPPFAIVMAPLFWAATAVFRLMAPAKTSMARSKDESLRDIECLRGRENPGALYI